MMAGFWYNRFQDSDFIYSGYLLWQPNYNQDFQWSCSEAEGKEHRGSYALHPRNAAWQNHHIALLSNRGSYCRYFYQFFYQKEIFLSQVSFGHQGFILGSYLEGGFPKRFSYLICIMSLRLYIGWPMVLLPGPTVVQVRIQGGVRIINPPLTIMSIRLFILT